MTDLLHMAQLDLDVSHLMGVARDRGWSGRHLRWDDLGYLVHQQLAALFQGASPQPFRAVAQRGRWLTVLGYTSAEDEQLRRHADEFGPPAERQACRLDALRTKPMPSSLFQAGRQLGFEVRVCPVVRLARAVSTTWCGRPRTFRAGAELDAYLCRRYLHGEENSREDVYVDWLRHRLAGAAGLHDARLSAFRRVRTLRQGRRNGNGKRKPTVSERPDALITGTLEVQEPDPFRALMSRGIGRHRAFGFGMLLLRPPG